MILLHLGDLHLGKAVNEFSLIEDQRYILEEILRITEERRVDCVLIAGDVYDKRIPSEEAVRLLDDFLCGLADRNVTVCMISGNHDSDERLNYAGRLLSRSGIHIASRYEGTVPVCSLKDAWGEVDIRLLPFIKASRVRYYFPEAEIRNYDDAVRVALEADRPDPARRNVLAAHQFVVGSTAGDPRPGGSESSAVLNVGTVEKVSFDCFRDFDYVALGHIHSPQRVGRDTVRYAGSPLKYSLSEVSDRKTVPLITMKEKGSVEVELIPLKPRRDLRHVTGPMECLLTPENVTDPDDYMYVTLTDEDPILDAMDRIRQVYPNTMKLDYRNRHTEAAERLDFGTEQRERSFHEVIGDFYSRMYGVDISEEELEILDRLAERAGVIHETH